MRNVVRYGRVVQLVALHSGSEPELAQGPLYPGDPDYSGPNIDMGGIEKRGGAMDKRKLNDVMFIVSLLGWIVGLMLQDQHMMLLWLIMIKLCSMTKDRE